MSCRAWHRLSKCHPGNKPTMRWRSHGQDKAARLYSATGYRSIGRQDCPSLTTQVKILIGECRPQAPVPRRVFLLDEAPRRELLPQKSLLKTAMELLLNEWLGDEFWSCSSMPLTQRSTAQHALPIAPKDAAQPI